MAGWRRNCLTDENERVEQEGRGGGATVEVPDEAAGSVECRYGNMFGVRDRDK